MVAKHDAKGATGKGGKAVIISMKNIYISK